MDISATAPVASWIGDKLYWIFLAMMFINLLQRKHQEKAPKKRMATLFLGIAVFALLLVAQTINHFGGHDWMFYGAVVAFFVVIYRYRDRFFPFRFRSPVDGRTLTFQEIMFDDKHGDESE